jgi:hypothetical protein
MAIDLNNAFALTGSYSGFCYFHATKSADINGYKDNFFDNFNMCPDVLRSDWPTLKTQVDAKLGLGARGSNGIVGSFIK